MEARWSVSRCLWEGLGRGEIREFEREGVDALLCVLLGGLAAAAALFAQLLEARAADLGR